MGMVFVLDCSGLIFSSYIHVLGIGLIALNELIVPKENSSLGMYLGT